MVGKKSEAPDVNIKSSRILKSEEKISTNVHNLIRLDYTVFVRRLTEEAMKESDGIKLKNEDIDRVLNDVLREFQG